MKICNYCQKELEEGSVKCKYCGGWFVDDAEDKQKEIDNEKKQERVEGLLISKKERKDFDIGKNTSYYFVPQGQLIFLDILTYGFFELYWFYKNWKAVKIQEQKKISPFWRAIFAILFCYSLFKRIIISAKNNGFQTKTAPSSLATLYIIIVSMYRLPEPYDFIALFTFIPLIYVNKAIAHINGAVESEFKEDFHFNAPVITFMVIGALLWLIFIFDFLFPSATITQ